MAEWRQSLAFRSSLVIGECSPTLQFEPQTYVCLNFDIDERNFRLHEAENGSEPESNH